MSQPAVTDLFLRGYAVIPSPQSVKLQPGRVILDRDWTLVAADNIASRSLLQDLDEFHSVHIRRSPHATRNIIRLDIRKDAVPVKDPEVSDQGYRLSIHPGGVTVTGNAAPGLFYGVQTLLQLINILAGVQHN